jgi:hypothetical protein
MKAKKIPVLATASMTARAVGIFILELKRGRAGELTCRSEICSELTTAPPASPEEMGLGAWGHFSAGL